MDLNTSVDDLLVLLGQFPHWLVGHTCLLLWMQVTGEMVAIKKFKDSEGSSLSLMFIDCHIDYTVLPACHNAPMHLARPHREWLWAGEHN